MKAVIQRVSTASVTIKNKKTAEISKGLLILLGVSPEDTEQDAQKFAVKIAGLRIFSDIDDKMNLSVMQVDGEILVISNFTLYADCRKGKRPSFINSASPLKAEPLYELFCEHLRKEGVKNVKQGEFGADMKVELLNDGPVTIVIDSKDL